MKIYQIVMKGDERSERYAEISRESFQPAIDAGIFSEFVTFDAITPQDPRFKKHLPRFNFVESLMKEDIENSKPPDHSDTEKAGMMSHWELIRMQGNNPERFFIAEHDTFLLPDQLDNLSEIVKDIKRWKYGYANIGLFMGLYSLQPGVASWIYDRMVRDRGTRAHWPINMGPYGNLQRLYRTWCSRHPRNYHKAIHPWNGLDTLYYGDNIGQPFNLADPDKKNSRLNPTTQVISKELMVTQLHHGYREEWLHEPWTRCGNFHVVD